jgi:hypothetical protein
LFGQIKDTQSVYIILVGEVYQNAETSLKHGLLSVNLGEFLEKAHHGLVSLLATFFLHTRKWCTHVTDIVCSTTLGLSGLSSAWRNSVANSDCSLIVTLIITVIMGLTFRTALGYQWQHRAYKDDILCFVFWMLEVTLAHQMSSRCHPNYITFSTLIESPTKPTGRRKKHNSHFYLCFSILTSFSPLMWSLIKHFIMTWKDFLWTRVWIWQSNSCVFERI